MHETDLSACSPVRASPESKKSRRRIIEFADATTALWSKNAGAHPAGATLSRRGGHWAGGGKIRLLVMIRLGSRKKKEFARHSPAKK